VSLLEVKNLKVHFPVKHGLFSRVRGHVKAVDDVSLSIAPGETLGLVGESGCGKTTLGRAIIRLLDPTSGQVLFKGEDITQLYGSDLRRRRRGFQMIFQDPYGSLNPRMTVEQIIGEAIDIHNLAESSGARRARINELLQAVGLNAAHAQRYPHEFSGGQRQRIGIARALAVEPDLIVCDEPVSALDVSVQAQIINLLMDLQQQHGIAYLFIAHDLAVVEHISRRVMVMYLGKVVEAAEAKQLVRSPKHLRIVLPSEKVAVFHENLARHDRGQSASAGATRSPKVNAPRVHRVEPGDTLSAIALRYRVRLADLKRWNPGVEVLQIGQGIHLADR